MYKMAEEKKTKVKEVKPEEAITETEVVETLDPYQIIKSPSSTEKAIKSIEFDNKLTFVVDPRATKKDVKKAVEELFKVSVVKINIQNSITGQKKAYVKLGADKLASDISADLGLI